MADNPKTDPKTDHDIERRQEEFSRISARVQRKLFLYIFNLIPNAADADEVLQNANLVLWRKFDQFDPSTSFFAWAARVAHFEVLKFRDRQKRDILIFQTPLLDQIDRAVLSHLESADDRLDALQKCMAALCEADRQIFLMRYAEEATTQSVADELGRPVKTIYSAIHRIREALMECITLRIKLEDRR